ncbi:MAG: hypothetical protein A2787_09475 [Omnitrophica WOR_2 bacterium RIFCSPHIGHO2_01_FULL_48_9]|nr:MAG: hypothetical protein A2787_09475 [Omnitrophica WOR_2 bacterium RIFCSPHIGHO2_01_FULL_48_9]
MIKPLKLLNVRIPEQLDRDLKTISRRDKVPVSDLVRESLQQYVVLKRFRQLRKSILPFAAKSGFLTDDDIFHKVS